MTAAMAQDADSEALPITCTLEAGEMSNRGEALRSDLFAHVEERRMLPDGMSYRFPGSDEFRDKLLAFAAAERTCCAFFRIELAFEPGLGPIWLTLTGADGVKEFIEQTFEGKASPGMGPHVPTVPRISRDELKARLDRDERIAIVEALPEMYYRRAHLPGALNIPVERVNELAPHLLPDKRAEIVVYCANLPCPSSGMAARALIALGYSTVREYVEGKQDWIEAGYPTERGRPAPAA